MSVFDKIALHQQDDAQLVVRWDRCPKCMHKVAKGDALPPHLDLTKGAMRISEWTAVDEVGSGPFSAPVPASLRFWVCEGGPKPVFEGEPAREVVGIDLRHEAMKQATVDILKALTEHPSPAYVRVVTKSGTEYRLKRFGTPLRAYISRDGGEWEHTFIWEPRSKHEGLRTSTWVTTPIVTWQVCEPMNYV